MYIIAFTFLFIYRQLIQLIVCNKTLFQQSVITFYKYHFMVD